MNHRGGCFKTRPRQRSPVAQVFRFQIVGLLVEVVGAFVVLARLGVLALVVESLRLVGGRRQGNRRNQQQHKRRTLQASHSLVLTSILSELILSSVDT